MDLEQLKSMGLVQANPLVKREIKVRYRPLLPQSEWADPAVEERAAEEVDGVVTVWLRKLTAADQMAVGSVAASGGDAISLIIHLCVFKEDGTRLFPTVDDAAGLDKVMFAGLLLEINKLNEGTAKKSRPRTSSGASSRSPSADAVSPNGNSSSQSKNSQSGTSTEKRTAP